MKEKIVILLLVLTLIFGISTMSFGATIYEIMKPTPAHSNETTIFIENYTSLHESYKYYLFGNDRIYGFNDITAITNKNVDTPTITIDKSKAYVWSKNSPTFRLISTVYGTNMEVKLSEIWDGTSFVTNFNWTHTKTSLSFSEKALSSVFINAPNQYCIISSPNDNYKTVSKTINYNVLYRIKADSVSDIVVHIKGLDGKPLSENSNGLSEGIRSHTGKQVGEFYEGNLNIFINYIPSFIGNEGIIVTVESVEYAINVSDSKNIEIVSFIDSNYDGKDDFTNENAYVPPREPKAGISPGDLDRTAYSDDIWGEIQYLGDKLISFITLPFKFVVDSLNFVTKWANDSISWINQISLFFSTFIGFLPVEIITAIQMLVYVFVIFGIVKLMRG